MALNISDGNFTDGSIFNESLSTGSLSNVTIPNRIPLIRNPPDMFVANTILIITGFIQVLGIIGNGMVVIRVVIDKKLHTITYVILAALAVSDGIALSTYLISNVIRQFQPTTSVLLAILALCNASFFSSAFHVLYVAIVRYLILIYPLKTLGSLKTKYMIAISILIYIVSGVIAGLDIVIEDTLEYTIIMWLIYFIPLIIMIILHGIKFYHLKNNRLKQSSLNDSATMKTMTKIILWITLSSFFLPLPTCVLSILQFAGTRMTMEGYLGASLVFSLNNCVNPFLYCFLSQKFRNSVKECCSCICGTNYRQDSQSSSMTVTTRSSRTSSMQTTVSVLDKENTTEKDKLCVDRIRYKKSK